MERTGTQHLIRMRNNIIESPGALQNVSTVLTNFSHLSIAIIRMLKLNKTTTTTLLFHIRASIIKIRSEQFMLHSVC